MYFINGFLDVVPQGNKIWRRCVSEDLIHWSDQGCGLKPEEWYEKNGCYSGSGITEGDSYYLFLHRKCERFRRQAGKLISVWQVLRME